VAHAVSLGCRPVSAEDALAAIRDRAGTTVGR
jgi:hypothetical protein